MPKRQFIWLMIRFLAAFWLLMAAASFLRAPLVAAAWTMMGWPWDPGSTLISLMLGGTVIKDLATIAAALYLLLGGRLIFKLVNRTSANCNEDALQTEDYLVILVRFFGGWWLWQIVKSVGGLLLAFAAHLVLVRMMNIADPSQVKSEELREVLESMSITTTCITLANAAIYAILAWYFLKRANTVIRLLQRRWLGPAKSRPAKNITSPNTS